MDMGWVELDREHPRSIARRTQIAADGSDGSDIVCSAASQCFAMHLLQGHAHQNTLEDLYRA